MTRQAFPVFTCDVAVAANAAERSVSLDGVDTTSLASGQFAVITTGGLVSNMYRLDKTSTATADGVTVVAPVAGPGRWLRWAGDGPDPAALLQTEWHINATTGSDSNDGSAAAPLASWAELRRRYGTNPIIPQSVQVFIESDLDEILSFDGRASLASNVIFRITGGVRDVLASGTLSNVVTQDRGTQTPMRLDDAGIDAFVDERIRFLDGAAEGATCWGFRSPAGDQLDCVQSVTYDTSADPLPANATPATPSAGDSYVVEELWRVSGIDLRFARLVNAPLIGDVLVAVAEDLDLFPQTGMFLMRSDTLATAFVRSRTRASVIARDTVCRFTSCFVFCNQHNGHGEVYDASSLKSPVSTMVVQEGAHIQLRGDAIVSGGTLLINEAFLSTLNAAVFDSNSSGIQLANARSADLGGIVWGDGNADFGWDIRGVSVHLYQTGSQPTLTGDTGDTQIGGATVAYGSIPLFDTDTASGMVEDV